MNIDKICMPLTISPMQDPVFWDSMLGTFASIATICAATLTAVAVFVAYQQLTKSHIQSSLGLYQQYLQLCVQYPSFTKGMKKPIQQDCPIYAQYLWFVATMLFSFEQILLSSGKDPQWVLTIKDQLKNHKEILSSSGSLERNEWEAPFLQLIREVLDQ